MHISFNLKGLDGLKDYPRRELSVAFRIENKLKELLKNAQLIQSPEVVLIQQQIDFITEEINLLKEKEQLLINIHNYLYDSVKKSDSEIMDIMNTLKDIEHI